MSAEQCRTKDAGSRKLASGLPNRAARVLVVDDSADSCRATGRLLEMFGCEVATAQTGGQALQLAKTFLPNAVLLDIGLPDLTGHEVVGEMKKMPPLSDTTFIALSGYDSEADRQASLAVGFHHHLVKPASPDELLSLLVRKSADSKSA